MDRAYHRNIADPAMVLALGSAQLAGLTTSGRQVSLTLRLHNRGIAGPGVTSVTTSEHKKTAHEESGACSRWRSATVSSSPGSALISSRIRSALCR